MLILNTLISIGLCLLLSVSMLALAYVFYGHCTLRAGALVYMEPDEESPVYYLQESECIKYVKIWKWRKTGFDWLPLVRGGYVPIKYVSRAFGISFAKCHDLPEIE